MDGNGEECPSGSFGPRNEHPFVLQLAMGVTFVSGKLDVLPMTRFSVRSIHRHGPGALASECCTDVTTTGPHRNIPQGQSFQDTKFLSRLIRATITVYRIQSKRDPGEPSPWETKERYFFDTCQCPV